MKEYNKEQLIQEFGKPAWTNTGLIDKVKYISGLDVFDTYIETKKSDRNQHPIYFVKYPNGFVIELFGARRLRTGILTSLIKYFVIEQQEQIVSQKNKSVVGRALVGGLLLGPLGAVVGGMSGVGSKSTKLTDYPDNILTVCVDNAGKDDYILFAVSNKHFKDVEKFLKTSFPTQYKNFNEIAEQESKSQSNIISVADEITKLKELLDIGALTQDEFNEQKTKILNQ